MPSTAAPGARSMAVSPPGRRRPRARPRQPKTAGARSGKSGAHER